MKPGHRWNEEVAEVMFTFEDRGSFGEVFWQKRKELLLKAGARLTPEPQMNKDGTENYSARFAKVLRDEYADRITDGITTEDIIFPSPNELGIFLRYGGDNTWANLKDKDGKSLDEWTRVE
jgi:hypothetical protein